VFEGWAGACGDKIKAHNNRKKSTGNWNLNINLFTAGVTRLVKVR
jgi:hypothetical protein